VGLGVLIEMLGFALGLKDFERRIRDERKEHMMREVKMDSCRGERKGESCVEYRHERMNNKDIFEYALQKNL